MSRTQDSVQDVCRIQDESAGMPAHPLKPSHTQTPEQPVRFRASYPSRSPVTIIDAHSVLMRSVLDQQLKFDCVLPDKSLPPITDVSLQRNMVY